MEGLISARLTPVCPRISHQQYAFSSLNTLRLAKSLYKNPLQMINQSKSFNSVSASIQQPLESAAPAGFDNTVPSKDVLDTWKNANAVCFDVDSTVCLDEGIDELAEFCGAGKAVAEWTARVMNGSVPFEDALAARLSLLNPSLSHLQDFLEKKTSQDFPGIDELIKKLKANNTDVYLISGGFRQPNLQEICTVLFDLKVLLFIFQHADILETEFILKLITRIFFFEAVASLLGIPCENIFTNQLLFRSSGEFLGFDRNEFTSRSGGKATAVQHIRKVHGYKSLVMIGDGATGLEARRPGGANLFICYAGVQLREAVASKADYVDLSGQMPSI
ncbi:PREDICTED: phosphoserine phosphatase, chloroplastic-like [Nelumbo nucifera]|uniref:phosphoserine phosphatase n=1 Tax=Nelumbo nucifera TaxID=4432 RepID=A0A1U8Q5U6_NELNU|nr:PREDICTED: phosphoserine phosphatase, chloroplastic-like [Nelumbo nucifera]